MSSKTPLIRHARGFQDFSRIEPDFFPGAKSMRRAFDEVFQNPFSSNSKRFCWDFWSVPDQYRLLRTPAESFFPKPVTSKFLTHLLAWGRTHLGCQMISHPWLSAYSDGCHQAFHSDVPHGPFSFVFSLTRWKERRFQGGETLIAQPRLLRYFSEMQKGASHEERDLVQQIPPRFNQLTVFDPRFPHGVAKVHGVDSILDSRLVIHGWFTDPFKQVMKPMDAFASGVMSRISSIMTLSGLLSLRLHIERSGRIGSIEVLISNLVDSAGTPLPGRILNSVLQSCEVGFPASRSGTQITLPLLFQG